MSLITALRSDTFFDQIVCACSDRHNVPGLFYSLQWSREVFNDLFVKPVQSTNSYLSEPDYVETTLKAGGQNVEQLLQIRDYLVNNKPISFEECIAWARLKFEYFYNNEIQQLLYSLPRDAVRHTPHVLDIKLPC